MTCGRDARAPSRRRSRIPGRTNANPDGAYYFNQIRVDPGNDLNIFVTQDGFRHSADGGRTWNVPRVSPRMFGDFRALWFDPENPNRMIPLCVAGHVAQPADG